MRKISHHLAEDFNNFLDLLLKGECQVSTTPIPTPTVSLDDALTAVTAAEATLKADQANVLNIQTAIITANAPLQVAEDKVTADVTAYNSSIDVAVAALQAAKIPVVNPAPASN